MKILILTLSLSVFHTAIASNDCTISFYDFEGNERLSGALKTRLISELNNKGYEYIKFNRDRSREVNFMLEGHVGSFSSYREECGFKDGIEVHKFGREYGTSLKLFRKGEREIELIHSDFNMRCRKTSDIVGSAFGVVPKTILDVFENIPSCDKALTLKKLTE